MKKHRILSILALLALAGSLPLLAAPGDGEGERGPRGWERFAERHDVNGDGQVTRDELFQTFELFDRLDENGDGVVTAEELPQLGCRSQASASSGRAGDPERGPRAAHRGSPYG